MKTPLSFVGVTMSSSTSLSTRSRIRLCQEIEKYGVEPPWSCDNCVLTGSRCIAMPERLRCSECVRKGRSCVSLSWEGLDRTRDDLSKKIAADEKILAEVMMRLLRNRALLAQADKRAKDKAACLDVELLDEDCPAAAVGTGLSPALWQFEGLVQDVLSPSSNFAALSETAQAFQGSSGS